MSIPYEPSIRRAFEEDSGASRTYFPPGFVDSLKSSLTDDSTRKVQYTRFMRAQEVTFVAKDFAQTKLQMFSSTKLM